MQKQSTIRLDVELKELLRSKGRMGQSYNAVLRELLLEGRRK